MLCESTTVSVKDSTLLGLAQAMYADVYSIIFSTAFLLMVLVVVRSTEREEVCSTRKRQLRLPTKVRVIGD